MILATPSVFQQSALLLIAVVLGLVAGRLERARSRTGGARCQKPRLHDVLLVREGK